MTQLFQTSWAERLANFYDCVIQVPDELIEARFILTEEFGIRWQLCASSAPDRMTGADSPDFIACGRAYEREEQERVRVHGSRRVSGILPARAERRHMRRERRTSGQLTKRVVLGGRVVRW